MNYPDTQRQTVDDALAAMMLSDDQTMVKKAQDISADYIQDRVRELSFADQLLPPDVLTPASPEISRTPYNDQLFALVEVDTTSVGAMQIGLRDTPDAVYAKGVRIPVGFETLSTPNLVFDERILLAYRISLTKMYEDAALKALHEAKDRSFLVYFAGAIELMQDYANAGVVAHTSANERSGASRQVSKFKGFNARNATATNFNTVPLHRRDFVKAKQLMLSSVARSGSNMLARAGGLHATMVLLTEYDHLELSNLSIDDTGSALQGDLLKNGWNDNILAGMRYIRTIKSHVLRPGIIYFITDKKFLGRSFQWQQMKFWLEKKPNFISWMAWVDIGVLIANIASVVVCELFSGSTTPTATTSGYENAIPMPLSYTPGLNNKVLDGRYSPVVAIA